MEAEKTEQVEITIPNEMDVVATSLLRKESTICLKPNCCIFKVPEYVKKGKGECYEPCVISIGPVFYKYPKLEPMQELKLILLKCFRDHPDNASPNMDPYIVFVRENEEEIRECYQQNTSLSSDEFIEMIVLDAVFLIYFFLIYSGSDERPSIGTPFPFMNQLDQHINYIRRDCFLMENQLPFFVIRGIYDMAFAEVSPRLSLVVLAVEFIFDDACSGHGTPMPEAIASIIHGKKITDASSIKHLLHLRRMCCYLPLTHQGRLGGEQRSPYHKIGNATQLSAAGVKFKPNESNNLFDITFDKTNGELKIPKLSLIDGTDVLYQNILIFEQFGYPSSCFYFFDYMLFFDQLIDSGEDIQILQQNDLLHNGFGSDEDVANLFNNVLKNLPSAGIGFLYAYVNNDLEEYTSSPWNRWKAILWSKYFNHPWAIISVIAAVILLILTLLQTTTGFLQLD